MCVRAQYPVMSQICIPAIQNTCNVHYSVCVSYYIKAKLSEAVIHTCALHEMLVVHTAILYSHAHTLAILSDSHFTVLHSL